MQAGKVIGILYVGIPVAQLDAMLAQAIETMAIAAMFAALLVLALTMLLCAVSRSRWRRSRLR